MWWIHIDPEEAKIFVEKTNVDSLAVAIGTAHGVYCGVPKLDLDRLSEIRKVVVYTSSFTWSFRS